VFERPKHQHVASLLGALDADLLRARHCYFGGGTAIVLRHGEYRESADVDFLVSDIEAYRALRRAVGASAGIDPLLIRPDALSQIGDVRADQYGIRAQLGVMDGIIKFEIVFEARIDLEEPAAVDVVLGVTTLSRLDMAASKLLANSDRWRDDGMFSRDLIDLAMLDLKPAAWQAAIQKAESAYGAAIRSDLARAIDAIETREGWMDRCMQQLSVTVPRALLWQRLRRLRPAAPGPGSL